MSVIIPEGYALLSYNMRARAANRPMAFTIGVWNSTISSIEANLSAYEAGMVASGMPFSAARFSSDYQYLGMSATIGTESGPIPWRVDREIDGTATIVPPPPNVSVLVRKRTTRGGKRGRGRWYMPCAWISENMIDHLGNIDANISTVQGVVDDLIDGMAGADLVPQILHAPSKLDPAAPVPPPTDILAMSVQRRVATQRKRLR